MTISSSSSTAKTATDPGTTMETLPEGHEKPALQQIGGFDLISRRPVIARKTKSLYVISGQNVRSYSTETGAFLEEYSFGNSSTIVAIQAKADNADELLVVCQNGHLLHWNLKANTKSVERYLRTNHGSVVSYFRQLGNRYYFTLTKEVNEDKIKQVSQLFYCTTKHPNKVMVVNQLDLVNSKQTDRAVAFGPTEEPQYCATIYKDKLFVYQLPIDVSSIRRMHSVRQSKTLTCVAFHPTEEIIATGDSLGQIILWSDVLSTEPTKKVMHWHSQAVNDITFSPHTGAALYSVGNEKVLVKWNLVGQFAGEKTFMPRLGEAIRHVVVNEEMIVITLIDQTIQIIDSQMNGVRTVIEGLTRGFDSSGRLLAGMQYNSRLNSLVLNGRVGHLQLYCPSTQKQLYQLDITEQNVISAVNVQRLKDRLKSKTPSLTKVYPIEVVKIAVCDTGKWMATVEYRDDEETLPEIRLKFWSLGRNSHFGLNTTIHLPHQEKLNSITFSPTAPDGSGALHLVSTSADRSFKVWDLNRDSTGKTWWSCSRTASLNSHSIPRLAAFSADLSLVAVLFDRIITLWTLDSPTTLRCLSRLDDTAKVSRTNRLIFLDFGVDNCSHYLLQGHRYHVEVRNIVQKFEVVFKYGVSAKKHSGWNLMKLNQQENVLALVNDGSIELLSLTTQAVILQVDLSSVMISVIFTPELPTGLNTRLPLKRSTFYCLNEQHELFQLVAIDAGLFTADSVTLVGTEESQKTKLYMTQVQSQLSLMFSKKSKSRGGKGESLGTLAGADVNRAKNRKMLVEKYFYNVPSHVLPPVNLFEKSYLSSLMQCLDLSANKQITTTIEVVEETQSATSSQTKQPTSSGTSSKDSELPSLPLLDQSAPLEQVTDYPNELITGKDRFKWLRKSLQSNSTPMES